MENFSTRRVAMLPQAANLVTLGVLVAATWWSGAQRPADQPVLASEAAATSTNAALPLRQGGVLATTDPTTTTTTTDPSLHWPVRATALLRDGLQAVGYQPGAIR